MTTSHSFTRLPAALLLSALFVGCVGTNGSAESGAPGQSPSALPSGHPQIPATAPQTSAPVMVGVVLEQVDGGGYTYARLSTETGEVWTAGPVATLVEGETVTAIDPFPMEDFRSSALDRVFEVVYFVGGYRSGQAALPPDATVGVVLQVLNSGGYTYLEVETEGAATWLAASALDVSTGDQVAWRDASLMRGFTSSSLNRTFDEILFVGYLHVVE